MNSKTTTDTKGKGTVAPSRRAVLVLAGAAATFAAVTGYRLLTRPVYDGGHLSVEDAHRQAAEGTILLVDIRQPEEWRDTGIPEHARPIDMRRDDFPEALTAALGADRSRPIALICARGVRSARLSTLLTEAGFNNILDVPEGMLGSAAGPGWLAKDLPVTPYSETAE